jgi:glycosyltransferase involved in cell wall biosynthesis
METEAHRATALVGTTTGVGSGRTNAHHRAKTWVARLPAVVLAAMIVHVIAALALMPVSGQPYDLAALTGASEAWLRWGFPLLYNWKFGFDLTVMGLGAQALRFAFEQVGMSGAAALATAWKLPLVTADLLIGITLLDLGRRLEVRRPALIPTLWLLSPVPLWVSAGHGQVEPLMVLSFVLALDLMLRGRLGLAGVVVGLGVGIEYLPGAIVLVAGLWLYTSVIQRREAVRFMGGFFLALLACFGPALLTGVGRASLLSGLSFTAGVTAQAGRMVAGQVAGSSSVWSVFGLSPGGIWVPLALLGAVGLLVVVARRSLRQPTLLERQRLGMVAAGGLLLCVVLLDPGALPQFADLALGGLCLIGLVVGLNPLVIVLGPLLQLAGGFFYVYGGSFQSYWYDMWYRSGNPGWSFPQSPLLSNISDRLGALIMVAGLLWVLTRAATPQVSLPQMARLRLPPGGTVLIGAAVAIAIAGSGFLAVWSLQPGFWSGVGQGGPAALVDFASITASRSGQVTSTQQGADVSYSSVLVKSAAESKAPPTTTLSLQSKPLLLSTKAGEPIKAAGALETATIPKWSSRAASVRSVWVSVLLGRKDWLTASLAATAPPTLTAGTDTISATSVDWLVPGWALLSYPVPAAQISAAGTLQLSLRERSPVPSPLIWNGTRAGRWLVVDVRSGEAVVAMDGVAHRTLVSAPPPLPGLYSRDVATVPGLPRVASTTVTDVSLGGVAGKIVGAALVWPSTAPLDGVIPGFWLFELGLLDLALLLAGAWLVARLYQWPYRRTSARRLLRVPTLPAPPEALPRRQQIVGMTSRYPVSYMGGVERVAGALADRLGDDAQPWVAVPVAAYSARKGLARVPLLGDFVAAIRLARRTARGFDAVLVHGAEYAWAPLLVGKATRRPTIVVWHGVRAREAIRPPRLVLERVAQRVFSWVSDRLQVAALGADATVTVSPQVADDLRERFGFRGTVHVIPNGVEQRGGADQPGSELGRSSERFRRGRRPPACGLRAIWVGTSPYRKGLDTALEAIELARRGGQEVTLTVVGVAPDEVVSLSRKLPGGIVWKGRLAPEEVDRLLLEHDVLLSPTRYEACGMAVLEALAAGLPVIGSAVLKWQVGNAGTIVSSEDARPYSKALTRLGSARVRHRLSRLAVERARQFSWNAAAAEYVRVLDETALRRQRSAATKATGDVALGHVSHDSR